MSINRRHLVCLAMLMSWLGIQPASAQSYPSRTVTIIVPYAPGGAVDAMGRLMATKLADQMQVPVIVKNVPGASGTIGIGEVARSAGDGYTLLYAPSTIAIFPALFQKLRFDPVKDLRPVTQFIASSMLIAAHPQLDAQSVPELIALAKAKPGKLFFGSAGVADTLQLGMEMFKVDTGTDLVAVPYKGQGPMYAAMLGGEVTVGLLSIQLALPAIRSGKLKALAVTGPKRSAALPEVPTVGETVPGYELTSWHGVFAPSTVPREVIDRIQREVSEISKDPSVRKTIEDAGNEIVASTPEAFNAKFLKDVSKFKTVVREAKLPPQD